MLQTHVNNDIYNKYCLIHNTENKIIDNVQIGFTKNARTLDHIFVMKSLIAKCINVNGGKLYSCFVDFRKAFDSVIHPGLQVELNELDINGKFYDILCSLYAKSSVCVRLGEHRTDLFESQVGVVKEMYEVLTHLRFSLMTYLHT